MYLKAFLLSLIPVWSYTQEEIYSFALVQDAEGFVNVRHEPVIKNTVKDTLATGGVIWCYDKKEDWYYVDYDKKGTSHDGYLHRSRVKLISSFEKIPVYKEGKDQIVFRKDRLGVFIVKKGIYRGRIVTIGV